MYRGLQSPGRAKPATEQSKYGMRNKVHSVQVSGMGQADYYGPPQPGQDFRSFQAFMKTPFYTASGAVIGALVAGPIGAVVGGIGSWLLSSDSTKKSKPIVQGG